MMLFHWSFFDGPNIVFNTNFSSIIGRNMELFKKHLFRLIYAMPAVSWPCVDPLNAFIAETVGESHDSYNTLISVFCNMFLLFFVFQISLVNNVLKVRVVKSYTRTCILNYILLWLLRTHVWFVFLVRSVSVMVSRTAHSCFNRCCECVLVFQ